jgi:predicted anti-sigma-YlaC factor YlaD
VTKARDQMCDHVQLAVMAKLDGERPLLTGDELDAHVAGCDECRDAIAGMTRLHARLDALSDDTPSTDLWSAIHPRIARGRILESGRERVAVGALVALVLAWRTAQLVFDVPVPVLNGLVPLAVAILIGWRVAGDPLAIQSLVLEEQQERA